ncbi:hypothetical protein GQ43DRAFT_392364 [Delitschia confertaspora ATCC 74209]|uniref:Glycosyltransferase family 34 protein n=1 Tax=Delitschia confertaspora ATCC 74209 TaxID=1513339 RepID=A0A9P4JNJ1_9PLEO|nr:hypothetical protein GQ43DRAFT_392364 [Delitschia confertaspora ATCC 74209]
MGIASPFRSAKLLIAIPVFILLLTLWSHSDFFSVSKGYQQQYSPNEVVVPDNVAAFKQQVATGSKYRIGKLTASFGEPDPSYEEAIESHQLHNQLQGYPHYILRERLMSGLWSKHAWIMTIIGQELAKPETERLHWLFWHDRDTVIMNPQIPLDIFLPPEDKFPDINLICNNDRNGLNNGVFLLRISDWSFKLFAAALSLHEYHPEITLKYTEQSAMEEAIKVPWRQKSVAFVPQRWFNGYPPIGNAQDQKAPRIARPGSVLIHFAGNRDGGRPQRIAHWHEVAKNRTAEWDKPANQTMYLQEIEEYWDRLYRGEEMDDVVKELGKRSWLSHDQNLERREKRSKRRRHQSS